MSGAPALRFHESATLFLGLPLDAARASVRIASPSQTLFLSRSFLDLRVITRVRRCHNRLSTQELIVCCHCIREVITIARTLVKHIVVRDDLVLAARVDNFETAGIGVY